MSRPASRWIWLVPAVAFAWVAGCPGTPVAGTTECGLQSDWATYLHGSTLSKVDLARDVAVDAEGNAYVTGGSSDPAFPTTPGAYQTVFGRGGTPTSVGSVGPMDVFVMKFSPAGQLVWSTLLGGPNYDRTYAVEVDDTGVYVAGRAGEGFPTSAGVVQPAFAGDSVPNTAYGRQDGFVAKLSLDGQRLLWSTYFGDTASAFLRDMDIGTSQQVCVAVGDARSTLAHVTPGAFQPAFGGGTTDAAVACLDPAASRVVWGTFVGGSGDDGIAPSVRVDPQGNVLLQQSLRSTNAPTTAGAYQRSQGGGNRDYLLTKLTSGGTIVYSSYFGGSGNEDGETHSLAVNAAGEAILGGQTSSPNLPVTAGALSASLLGPVDGFVARLSADGARLLACTYLGGSANDLAQGLAVDSAGYILVSGGSGSRDFPTTPGAPYRAPAGGFNAFLVKLSPDLRTLVHGALFGGSLEDNGRGVATGPGGTVFVIGHTYSADFPARNGYQMSRGGDMDAFLARFTSVLGGPSEPPRPPSQGDTASRKPMSAPR